LLWAGWSGDRIPVVPRFSASIQTSPGAHPGTVQWVVGLYPGGKVAEHGIYHPPLPSTKFKERVELAIPLLPLWVFIECSRVNFTFLHYILVKTVNEKKNTLTEKVRKCFENMYYSPVAIACKKLHSTSQNCIY